MMHQFFEMGLHAFGERLEMVAAFEATDQPASGMRVGDGAQHFGHVGEILRLQAERADRVAPVARRSRR